MKKKRPKKRKLKFYDERAWEIYPEGISGFIKKCELCSKDFKYQLKDIEGRSKQDWLKFFNKRPQLGIYTDYGAYYHGLCFWKKENENRTN